MWNYFYGDTNNANNDDNNNNNSNNKNVNTNDNKNKPTPNALPAASQSNASTLSMLFYGASPSTSSTNASPRVTTPDRDQKQQKNNKNNKNKNTKKKNNNEIELDGTKNKYMMDTDEMDNSDEYDAESSYSTANKFANIHPVTLRRFQNLTSDQYIMSVKKALRKLNLSKIQYQWPSFVRGQGHKQLGKWDEPIISTVQVRTKNYIKSRVKQNSDSSLFKLADFQVFKCKPQESFHVSQHPKSWYLQHRSELPPDTFYLIMNMQLASIDISFVSTFVLKTNDTTMSDFFDWERLVENDAQYKTYTQDWEFVDEDDEEDDNDNNVNERRNSIRGSRRNSRRNSRRSSDSILHRENIRKLLESIDYSKEDYVTHPEEEQTTTYEAKSMSKSNTTSPPTTKTTTNTDNNNANTNNNTNSFESKTEDFLDLMFDENSNNTNTNTNTNTNANTNITNTSILDENTAVNNDGSNKTNESEPRLQNHKKPAPETVVDNTNSILATDIKEDDSDLNNTSNSNSDNSTEDDYDDYDDDDYDDYETYKRKSKNKVWWTPKIGYGPFDSRKRAESQSMWQRFLSGDSKFINSRLKMIPRIVQGSWYFTIPQRPVIIGRKAMQKCYRGPNYLEIDCQADSHSVVATKLTQAASLLSTYLIVDIMYTIEGRCRRELPERVLCAFQWEYLDLTKAYTLNEVDSDEDEDEYEEDEEYADGNNDNDDDDDGGITLDDINAAIVIDGQTQSSDDSIGLGLD